MIAVVGGIGNVGGGMVASLLLTVLPEGLRALGESNLRLLVYGTMVLFVLWFLPEGIGSMIERLLTSRRPPARARVAALAEPRGSMLPHAMTAAAPMLDVRGLSKHFGGVQALDSVTLAGLPGEVHGLVGPNGAGSRP